MKSHKFLTTNSTTSMSIKIKNKDRERKEIRWKNFMIPFSTWISWNFVTKLYIIYLLKHKGWWGEENLLKIKRDKMGMMEDEVNDIHSQSYSISLKTFYCWLTLVVVGSLVGMLIATEESMLLVSSTWPCLLDLCHQSTRPEFPLIWAPFIGKAKEYHLLFSLFLPWAFPTEQQNTYNNQDGTHHTAPT